MTVGEVAVDPQASMPLIAGDYHAAVTFLLDWLESRPIFSSVKAVGHRLVQGMKHFEPERITPKLLTDLYRITAYDPRSPFPGDRTDRSGAASASKNASSGVL